MTDRFREPDLDPEWGKDETDEMADGLNDSLLDRIAHGATDQDDAEAVRRIIEENAFLDRSFGAIDTELISAIAKFPTWPTDPLHALGVVHEEVGELSKAVLQQVYEPEKNNASEVHKEAIQAAAMAVRFVWSLDRYKYKPMPQHVQEPNP